MRGHSAAVSRYSSSAVVCSPVCVCVWTLFLTSSPFTPLRLSHLPFSLSLSSPLHRFCPPSLCPPVYCLSYQPIHQWLLFFNKWRRSRSAGETRMEAVWIQKGLLSLSLFILLCLPHVSIPSLPLFISPPTLSLSLVLPPSVSQEIAVKAGVHAERCPPLRRFAYSGLC